MSRGELDFVSKWLIEGRTPITEQKVRYMIQHHKDYDLTRLDTSKITDMGGMFCGVSGFNQDISNWDTSSVTNIWGMFQGADTFNQDISRWNTSKVECMDSVFDNTASFNQDISRLGYKQCYQYGLYVL